MQFVIMLFSVELLLDIKNLKIFYCWVYDILQLNAELKPVTVNKTI